MTDEGSANEPRRSEALQRLLNTLGENLREVAQENEDQQRRESLIASATEMVSTHGGFVIPMPLDLSGMSKEYIHLIQALSDEQAKASLFLSQLPRDHPYKDVFRKLCEAWVQAAMVGAIKIANHQAEQHGGDGEVGPREFNSSWATIAVAAVVGAIRFGQEHPDAFKGLEGIKEGDIDLSISQLIEWADQHATDGQEDTGKES